MSTWLEGMQTEIMVPRRVAISAQDKGSQEDVCTPGI